MAIKPPPEPIDHHYDIAKLTKVFAVAGLLALAAFVLMVRYDNDRDWKSWQVRFKAQDRERTLEARNAALAKIDPKADEEFRERRREGLRLLRQNQKALDAARAAAIDAEGAWYATDQRFRFKKAEMDTARYLYETARVQAPDGAETGRKKKAFERLVAAFEESRLAEQAARGKWDDAKAAVAGFERTKKEGEEGIKKLDEEWKRFQAKLKTLRKDAFFLVRNAPFADILAPNLKIEQVQLDGLHNDVSSIKAQRVDRCMTCHVAADKRGFEDRERYPDVVLRTHPRLDLFVDSNSPHPYARFGCTSCHGGRDRATDFMRAGHMPNDFLEYEKLEAALHTGRDETGKPIDREGAREALHETTTARWIERYRWGIDRFLETPMYPMKAVEAGCFRCHRDEPEKVKAPTLNKGVKLVENLGCWACHKMKGFEGFPKPGPSLARIAAKTTPEWTERWLENPRAFRPSTKMPRFFRLENFQDDEGTRQTDAMIAGITAFLFERSERPAYAAPAAGDAARGRQLYESLGCQGCHVSDPKAERNAMDSWRQFGPNLTGLSEKTNAAWLAAWLKNPKAYNPETRMPDLRLADGEIADLVAFLLAQPAPRTFRESRPVAADPAARDAFVLEGLQQTMTVVESRAALAKMSPHDKDLYVGEKMVYQYGCYSCHEIKGFENAKPIGVELSEWGNKAVHLLDFGFVHVPHTRADWLAQKVREPRGYDVDKVKSFSEKLRMPKFSLSPEEVRVVQTTVLGMQKDDMADALRVKPAGDRAAVEAGRRLVKDHNCQGCHVLEERGGEIRQTLPDVALAPPNIRGQGAKVQSDWLFSFLNAPKTGEIRPWLKVRMPTFGFTPPELNALTRYFAALEKASYPFETEVASLDARMKAAGAKTFEAMRCAQCHPTSPAAFQEALNKGAKPADLAPILSMAHGRLRYDWIADWIKRPEEWMPGTRMPTNFPKTDDPSGKRMSPLAMALDAPAYAPFKRDLVAIWGSEAEARAFIGDPDRVTKALRDHVWSLGNASVAVTNSTPPAGKATAAMAGKPGRPERPALATSHGARSGGEVRPAGS